MYPKYKRGDLVNIILEIRVVGIKISEIKGNRTVMYSLRSDDGNIEINTLENQVSSQVQKAVSVSF